MKIKAKISGLGVTKGKIYWAAYNPRLNGMYTIVNDEGLQKDIIVGKYWEVLSDE